MEDVIYSVLTSRIILNIRSVGSEVGTVDFNTSEYTDTLTRSVSVFADSDIIGASWTLRQDHIEDIELTVV